jgi:hypothetical protein
VVDISAARGVQRSTIQGVAAAVRQSGARIARDLGTRPPTLHVRIFATHHAYTVALWSFQRQRPQTPSDDSSAIVDATWLLGPLPTTYVPHTVLHVYTEWLLDRITGNRRDQLPPNTWLYDGLGELEAYRYGPSVTPGIATCHGTASFPIDITAIRRPAAWLAMRAGPLSSIGYCLAYGRVRSLVRTVGWTCLVKNLHRAHFWSSVPRRPERWMEAYCRG